MLRILLMLVVDVGLIVGLPQLSLGVAASAPHTFSACDSRTVAVLAQLRRAGLPASIAASSDQIQLAPGRYRLLTPIALEGAAEQESCSTLTIAPSGPGEVVLSGAVAVADFRPLSPSDGAGRIPDDLRHQIQVARLPDSIAQQIAHLSRRGFGRPGNGHSELFFRGERMPLARWPDGGYARIGEVQPSAAGPRFTIEPAPPFAARKEPDLWAFAYWHWDWASEHMRVAAADDRAASLSFPAGLPNYGVRQGQRIVLENALGALDRPGEWYLDRGANLLYFWPPAALGPADAELSIAPSLLRLNKVRGIVFDRFRFEMAYDTAIEAVDVSDVEFRNCTLSNIGTTAASISGSSSGLRRCSVHDIGDTAIRLAGGDRQTLMPGRLYVMDSDIQRFGLWNRTITAAAWLSGVGNIVSGNRIHEAPQSGVYFTGNDHIIERNIFVGLTSETGDAGAIYTGRDWTARGTLIRDNTLCNLYSPFPEGAKGVYLDDLASGISVVGNRFHNVQDAIFIGGGSDNVVTRNVVDGGQRPITLDARGLGWARTKVLDPDWDLQRALRAVPYDSRAYALRYPTLPTILDGDPGRPQRNVIQFNRIAHDGLGAIDDRVCSRQVITDNRVEPVLSWQETRQLFPDECLVRR